MKASKRGYNKAFQIQMIKTLMKKNYDVSPSCIDLDAEIDTTLSPQENWNTIKEKVLMLTPKLTVKYS